MTTDDAAKQRNDMAAALMELGEQVTPLFDHAEGMRAEMERRGWSPTAAEQVALAWLLGMVGMLFKGQQS